MGKINKKVLLVEDEAVAVMTLEDILKEWGICVSAVAANGKEAVLKAQIYLPDIVLMDISLPGEMDGIDAAEQIIQICSAKIIFLTGFDKNQYIERVSLINPFAYLEKPIDFNVLSDCLKKIANEDENMFERKD